MTVVPRSDYSETMILERRYRFSNCPRCHATTLEQAESQCRPHQDITGEYSCPGDGDSCLNPFELKWDTKGRACELTNASAKAEAEQLEEWCKAEAAKMETGHDQL